jgi:hypothetical protein
VSAPTVRYEMVDDEVGFGVKLPTYLGYEVVYLACHSDERLPVVVEDDFDRKIALSRVKQALHRFHLIVELGADLLLKWSALRRGVLWLASRAVQ